MKISFKIFIFILPVVIFIGCSKPLHKDSEFIMGTFVEVISPDPRASAIAFKEFKRLEWVFNLFDETSELSALNRSGDAVVSFDLFDILYESQKFNRLTDGAFDVTIAPLSLLWKKAISRKQLPAAQDIKKAQGLVGFDNLYLDKKTCRAHFLKEGVKIDLGGIAKGYAVDRAVAKLKEAQITSAIVNAGGNIFCLGENSHAGWTIGIQDPRQDGAVIGKMELKNKGISTSGDYEQFFIYQNKRYSHIIDPKTGYPADSGIISATVIAPDAMTADALSTACVVLGLNKAREVLKRFSGIKALLIDKDGKIYNL